MHVIPDSTMFRSYIIIYGICVFFGGIIAYCQFNTITLINSPFDNFIYCNSGLYSDSKNQISPNNDRPERDIKAKIKNSFRILRSVLIISLILIFGWLISSIGRNILLAKILNISNFLTSLFIPKSNQQNFIITSQNVLTLAADLNNQTETLSKEYRNAYKTVFGKLFRKNNVSPNQPLFIKSDKGNNRKNNANNQQK
uniref:Transmembrane protein n=1 Tax=Meloidogyne floridensis TaxID=298350 RepID=A0A915P8H6_9BILA